MFETTNQKTKKNPTNMAFATRTTCIAFPVAQSIQQRTRIEDIFGLEENASKKTLYDKNELVNH